MLSTLKNSDDLMEDTFSFLLKDEYHKLIDLAESVNLNEQIDFKCVFLCSKNEHNKLLGVAGIRLDYDIPKFEHIIVKNEYQKKGLALSLMKAMEDFLREKSYTYYTAFIVPENMIMRKYAVKFGFKSYKETDDGTWFFKDL